MSPRNTPSALQTCLPALTFLENFGLESPQPTPSIFGVRRSATYGFNVLIAWLRRPTCVDSVDTSVEQNTWGGVFAIMLSVYISPY